MGAYRKKQVVIEAWKLQSSEPQPEWFVNAAWQGVIEVAADFSATVDTREGIMRADPGDWIIRGIDGELYPCKPHIFDATYERV